MDRKRFGPQGFKGQILEKRTDGVNPGHDTEGDDAVWQRRIVHSVHQNAAGKTDNGNGSDHAENLPFLMGLPFQSVKINHIV